MTESTPNVKKTGFRLALLTLLLLSLSSQWGCKPAIKVVKALASIAIKAEAKTAVKGGARAATAAGAHKFASASADDVAKSGLRHLDDVAPPLTSLADDAARLAVHASKKTAAQQAARVEHQKVAAATEFVGQQLASIPTHLLRSAPRVTYRILVARYEKNQNRLGELDNELNNPSLTDQDAELIKKEVEAIGRDNERLQAKVAKLYRDLG